MQGSEVGRIITNVINTHQYYHQYYQHSPLLSPALSTFIIIITSIITLYKEAEAGAEERDRKDKLEKTPGTDRLRLPWGDPHDDHNDHDDYDDRDDHDAANDGGVTFQRGSSLLVELSS